MKKSQQRLTKILKKLLEGLDKLANPDVESETKQSNGVDLVEDTPAVNDSDETVVIFPDGSTKNE